MESGFRNVVLRGGPLDGELREIESHRNIWTGLVMRPEDKDEMFLYRLFPDFEDDMLVMRFESSIADD